MGSESEENSIKNFQEAEGMMSNIQNQLKSLKLGRNRGRPRKITKITNFFDFVLTNKRNTQKRNLQKKVGAKRSSSNRGASKAKTDHCGKNVCEERTEPIGEV